MICKKNTPINLTLSEDGYFAYKIEGYKEKVNFKAQIEAFALIPRIRRLFSEMLMLYIKLKRM